MAKALGIDDAVSTCDCCGKSNLKFTVVIELDDGEIVHYGQVCATRNTGKSRPTLNAEIKAESQRIRDAANAEYRASPERIAYEAKIAERNNRSDILPGIASMRFIEQESAAADEARARIAAKFGLKPYELHP